MRFFRQCAVVLPAAFLLAAFAFLLTHGSQDPGLSVYPFFHEWLGGQNPSSSPRLSFLALATLLFALPYVMTLAFVLLISRAERRLFGPPGRTEGFRDVFRRFNVVCLLILATALGGASGPLQRRMAIEAQVGPMLVAAAPFLAAVLSPVPAVVAAVAVMSFRRVLD